MVFDLKSNVGKIPRKSITTKQLYNTYKTLTKCASLSAMCFTHSNLIFIQYQVGTINTSISQIRIKSPESMYLHYIILTQS